MADRVSESENPAIPSPTPKPDRPRTNQDWWPNQLDLQVLQRTRPVQSDGRELRLREEFKTLDVEALKRDLFELMTTSQDWWPADYGHYGALFIRMSWHAAGTYRIADGRGGGGAGAQRFAPLNSWPDNASLDKARRLLWPLKQQYGRKISWADLLVFAGNCCPGIDGVQDIRLRLRTRGHLGARGDLLGARGHLARRRALQRRPATRRAIRRRADGPDLREPGGAQRQPRSAGGRPGHPRDLPPHGDERRGDAGAHHRRPHIRQDPWRGRSQDIGPEPEAAPIEQQGLGWKNRFGSGKGGDTITSGLEGAWTNKPTKWGNGFLDNLFNFEWELTSQPGRCQAVDSEECRGPGHGAGCARPVEAARAHDADDGPRAADRSGLRADREALPREPGRAGGRVRQGLVQAAAPRHGTDRRATSARGFRSRSCGRTRSPRWIIN